MRKGECILSRVGAEEHRPLSTKLLLFLLLFFCFFFDSSEMMATGFYDRKKSATAHACIKKVP